MVGVLHQEWSLVRAALEEGKVDRRLESHSLGGSGGGRSVLGRSSGSNWVDRSFQRLSSKGDAGASRAGGVRIQEDKSCEADNMLDVVRFKMVQDTALKTKFSSGVPWPPPLSRVRIDGQISDAEDFKDRIGRRREPPRHIVRAAADATTARDGDSSTISDKESSTADW